MPFCGIQPEAVLFGLEWQNGLVEYVNTRNVRVPLCFYLKSAVSVKMGPVKAIILIRMFLAIWDYEVGCDERLHKMQCDHLPHEYISVSSSTRLLCNPLLARCHMLLGVKSQMQEPATMKRTNSAKCIYKSCELQANHTIRASKP